MNLSFTMEVCTDSYQTSQMAELHGATRIELCASIIEGGLTPPLSLIQKVCSTISIPVHIIIRPRAGDFLYSDVEFELMKADIGHAVENGASGVVFGILNSDGSIDVERCRMLIALSKSLHLTFHRAFDMTSDPFLALEELISLGFDTILTSGQHQVAEDGLEVIRELSKRAASRISIMAGGGVSSKNVLLLHEAGVREFHFTAIRKTKGKMQFLNEVLQSLGHANSGNEYEINEFDESKMKNIVAALKTAL